LYFSNFSCGTASGAGLAAAGFAPACDVDLVGAFAGGVCAPAKLPNHTKAVKPNLETIL